MPSYSVATTKDNLSSLIDKALAGEEVIVTRHGKPVAEINRPRAAAEAAQQRAEIYDRIRQNLDDTPMMTTSYLDMKRQDEEDGAL